MSIEVKFKKGLQDQLSSAAKAEGTYYQCTDTGRLYLGLSDTSVIEVGNLINDPNGEKTSFKLQGAVGNAVLGTNCVALDSTNSLLNGTLNASMSSDNIKTDSYTYGVSFISSQGCYSLSSSSSTANTLFNTTLSSRYSHFGSGYIVTDDGSTDAKFSLIAANMSGEVLGSYSAIIGGQNGCVRHNNCVVLGGGISTTRDNMVYVNSIELVNGTSRGIIQANQNVTNNELIFNLPISSGTLALTGEVTASQTLTSGVEVGRITIAGVDTVFYAPQGGGGSTVNYTPSITTGTQLGTISIDSTDYGIFAPAVSVSDALSAGTKIGTITVGENSTDLYAPSGTTFVNVREEGSPLQLTVDEDMTITGDISGTDLKISSYKNAEATPYSPASLTLFSETGGDGTGTVPGSINLIGSSIFTPIESGKGVQIGKTNLSVNGGNYVSSYNTNELHIEAITTSSTASGKLYLETGGSWATGTIYLNPGSGRGPGATTSSPGSVEVNGTLNVTGTNKIYKGDNEVKAIDWSQTVTSGTKIATITIDGIDTDIYAPNGGGGGSTISYTPTVTEGTTLGTLTIDGTDNTIYAPTPAVITVSQTLTEGTEIGSISVDDTETKLYAPTPTVVSYAATVTEGTALGTLTIDGTDNIIYAEGEITADDVDALFED